MLACTQTECKHKVQCSIYSSANTLSFRFGRCMDLSIASGSMVDVDVDEDNIMDVEDHHQKVFDEYPAGIGLFRSQIGVRAYDLLISHWHEHASTLVGL